MNRQMPKSVAVVHPSRRVNQRSGDEGIALVVVLLLTLALSTIGASLLMLAQTDTYTSMNYRMMSQARYGAESGVLKAVNYLTQAYVAPGSVSDPVASYDMTVSPVTYGGRPVILSADPNQASNYPSSAIVTAFAAAAKGTLNAGARVSYSAYATLVSMRVIQEYGATAPRVLQTWHITATGSLAGTRPATVEVESLLERQLTAAHSFGVFATKIDCGAMDFGGGSVNDSYDSSNMTFSGGVPVTEFTGGSVGTNGNLSVNGNANVYGTLSTPRTGVGNCKSGAITALTTTGQAQVHEGLIQLPQSLQFPPPDPPNPMPPTTNMNLSSTNCATLGIAAPACSGGSGNITFDAQGGTMLFGNITANAGATVRLRAGTYNINSILLSGNATLVVETGPVYLNIACVGFSEPMDLTGGQISNPSFLPNNLHILYGGTGTLKIAGGSAAAAMIYAPRADVLVAGGSNFYGSIVGSTVKDTGGTHFHYDRNLKDDFFVAGNFMMSSFSWRKY